MFSVLLPLLLFVFHSPAVYLLPLRVFAWAVSLCWEETPSLPLSQSAVGLKWVDECESPTHLAAPRESPANDSYFYCPPRVLASIDYEIKFSLVRGPWLR